MSVEDAVDTLTQAGTDVLKMVHTHDGAAAVCMLLAYGSAKDRKRLVKAMKGENGVLAYLSLQGSLKIEEMVKETLGHSVFPRDLILWHAVMVTRLHVPILTMSPPCALRVVLSLRSREKHGHQRVGSCGPLRGPDSSG